MTALLSWLSQREDYLVSHPDRCTLDNLRYDKAFLEGEDLISHITDAQKPDDNVVTSYDSDDTTLSLTNEAAEITALDANPQDPEHANEAAEIAALDVNSQNPDRANEAKEITALDVHSQNPDLSGAETWSQENAQLTDYPALHLHGAPKPPRRSLGASRRTLVPPSATNLIGVSTRASRLRLGKYRPVLATALSETNPQPAARPREPSQRLDRSSPGVKDITASCVALNDEDALQTSPDDNETFFAISKETLRAVADGVQAEQLPKQRLSLDKPPKLPPILAIEGEPESYDERCAL